MTDGLVAGRFRLTALLGSGGTAAVFAAVDELVERKVALKLLHPHLAADRAAWDAFFEEVRAARSIVHPLIAEVFDAGAVDTDPPVVWIAMELVDGVTLEEHVREHGPLSGAVARVLIDGVLDALAAAHAGGVVHRDVTPANVMIDPSTLDPFDAEGFRRRLRLLDFGLADVPGRTTRGSDALLSGAVGAAPGVVASVPYASPEQLSGAAVTEASDVYQVGATLYFALTGRPPFEGATDVVVRAHLTAPPPLPSVVRRGVERAMDRLVATAMLKRPGDRFADAGAMRRALVATPTGLTAAPPARQAQPRAGEPADDVSTRVYRTAVPGGASAAAAPSVAAHLGSAGRSRSRWPGWGAAAAGAAALIGIIALSAAAGSAPSAAPTTGAFSSVPTGTAPVATPTPTDSAPVRAEVPAIVGLTVDEARALLRQRGFTVGTETHADGTTAADTVLAADPAPGTRHSPGTAVTLQIASGRNVIPSVIGQSVTDASAALSAAGFVASVEYGGTGEPGVVVGSSPDAGAVHALGSAVTVRAPVAAAPSATPSAPAPSAPPSPQPSGSATPVVP